ncbi:MAG: M50 family metallopeptidase, partial [Gemmatimonadaceae bacterium]|nr:M50 family metallopeptidase [Gemmatimonadaceae bacterium]
MRWAARIGTFAGISVYVHATFLLLIAWIGLSYWRAEQSIPAVVSGIVFILALFGCVVLHEFGHALTARRYGIRTRDITLYPIGGVARLERMPDEPRQELLVAVAGPAVNVVIAALLFLVLWLAGGFVPFEQLSVARGNFLERLMVVNIWLVVFNLIPAFPMDGGRMLRAALAMRMDYAR